MSDDNTDTPPWGSEENFDADKAWGLIQGLRADKATLQGRVITDEQAQMLSEYQALVEASQSDQERTQAELESARAAAGQVPTLTTENLKLQVALDKGIPAPLVKRLQGATREELEADADTLLGLVSTPKQGMKPNPAQGTSGGGAPSLDDQIAEARKSGNTRQAILLQSRKLLNVN